MHAEEKIPQQYQENWEDAWEVDGADAAASGTWCQEWMETTHPLVQSWRFDRIFFFVKLFHREVSQKVCRSSGGVAAETQQPNVETHVSGSAKEPDALSSSAGAVVTYLSDGSQQLTDNSLEERGGPRESQRFNAPQMQSVRLIRNTFQRDWGVGMSDHA